MRRTFVIVGHKVRTDAKFSLNDLSGSTGRLDIILRAINSAFMLSNCIRSNVDLYIVLLGEPDPPVSILMKGDLLKYLNPDERSTGALIRQALISKKNEEGWHQSTPGIYVSTKNYQSIIHELMKRNMIPVYLHEKGKDVQAYQMPDNTFFVLGDQFDLSENEEMVLDQDVVKLSLGPKILHSDHCITILHNILDRQHGWNSQSDRKC